MLNSSYIPSQYNPCRKVTVRQHPHPLLVGCCLLCRWVVSTYGQQVGAYHGGTMDACQLSHHGTNYRLGCISGLQEFLSHSEKLCMGPGPPNHTQDVSKGQMQTKPAPVDSHRGIWCRRVSRSKTVPGGSWRGQCHKPKRWCASLAPWGAPCERREKKTGCWLCVDAELAIGQCRLGGFHETCGLNNPLHHQQKMS